MANFTSVELIGELMQEITHNELEKNLDLASVIIKCVFNFF